ncbi:hypothetical protein A0J61_00474 [Choanephora cucurbitarum]|uniref:Rieske domain-containing protein n=1 Tax=Choanephora cucurbitarum TaxID=101091 RepID=A0A1C7NRC1_9FUNG|nr:hypothetical protein A0J61_00474 [Choanephora cucurbitarum]
MFEPTIKYRRVNESSEAPQDIPVQAKATTPEPETQTESKYDFTFEEEKETKIEADPNDESRIIITLSTGKKYSADRYCPHAGADLTYHGRIGEHDYPPEIGPILMCSIHYWEFPLEKGGSGLTSLNACPMDSTTSCPLEKKLEW